MAKKKVKKPVKKGVVKKSVRRGMSSGLATLALILNIIFPGIGSLIGGKVQTGIIQLILMIAVIFFFPTYVGIIAYVVAMVWGIVTGVKFIQGSQ